MAHMCSLHRVTRMLLRRNGPHCLVLVAWTVLGEGEDGRLDKRTAGRRPRSGPVDLGATDDPLYPLSALLPAKSARMVVMTSAATSQPYCMTFLPTTHTHGTPRKIPTPSCGGTWHKDFELAPTSSPRTPRLVTLTGALGIEGREYTSEAPFVAHGTARAFAPRVRRLRSHAPVLRAAMG